MSWYTYGGRLGYLSSSKYWVRLGYFISSKYWVRLGDLSV